MSNTKKVHHISSDVANKISTSQVIDSVASAIRQLIDNSIDANATQIEIRLDQFGYNSIEAIDNGDGIDTCNFESLCKPHSTSKLKNFSDMSLLSTLGFRGEALNALCALSSLAILTRSSTSLLGHKLTFNHSGELLTKTSVARAVGTTITAERLFHSLPVRRKELERTCKREYNRILSTIQCFALFRPDIRFICSNTCNGKSEQSICTPGSCNVKEVVSNLFGGMSNKNKMLEIESCSPSNAVMGLYGLKDEELEKVKDMNLSGFLSSCEHGVGRKSADRQYIFINKRPVDYAKICRTVNDVYQQYNKGFFPVLVLFIELPTDSVDANVTPDKKTIFCEHEKTLLAFVRSSIEKTLSSVLGNCGEGTSNGNASLMMAPIKSVMDLLNTSAKNKRPSLSDIMSKVKQPRLMDQPKDVDDRIFQGLQQNTVKGIAESCKPLTSNSNQSNLLRHSFSIIPHTVQDSSSSKPSEDKPRGDDCQDNLDNDFVSTNTNKEHQFAMPKIPEKRSLPQNVQNVTSNVGQTSDVGQSMEQSPVIAQEQFKVEQSFFTQSVKVKDMPDFKEAPFNTDTKVSSPVVDDSDDQSAAQTVAPLQYTRTQQQIEFSSDAFVARMKSLAVDSTKIADNKEHTELCQSAGVNSTAAEEALSKLLKKEEFLKMEIIGQFNSEFIIAQLDDSLFILDQHACDEKYNFEQLQKNSSIQSQRLIQPKHLKFGAVQEGVLKANLQIFKANGFDFDFIPDANGETRVLLSSTPILDKWNFNVDDIEEILTAVSEFPSVMYRPAKLRKIFASWACRKSVMFGKPLTKREMCIIVRHLAHLQQPWNCPHGRPTLRYLRDI